MKLIFLAGLLVIMVIYCQAASPSKSGRKSFNHEDHITVESNNFDSILIQEVRKFQAVSSRGGTSIAGTAIDKSYAGSIFTSNCVVCTHCPESRLWCCPDGTFCCEEEGDPCSCCF